MSKKNTKFIDAHAHVTSKYYSYDAMYHIFTQMLENDIEFLILNGGHRQENKEIIELKKMLKNTDNPLNKDLSKLIQPCIGIHPEDSQGADDYLLIKDLINDDIVGIGEIGLDYYYADALSREEQIASFENQVKLAKELNLPVVVHIRDKENTWLAYEDAFEILKKYKVKHMLHTFAGNTQIAKKFLEIDSYFSFSGVITFGSSQQTREVVKMIPLERILTETDSPYLRPHPFKNEINEPNKVMFTAYYIAGVLNIGMDKFVARVNKNVRELFNIK
ncbi:TatD family hydrolase [Mycoplasmopsis ciconiae]|uniref:TatD family hydrolase n=1 Tax=Mycoplasmopsis ciconiae TaxID=561067 RepID=A0ABU7ML62_9BACT|nr:TatD family hydrolase [Mycoplasmopsis ciconiae]